MLNVFVNADNLIRLDGLTLASDSTSVNNASVSYVLRDGGLQSLATGSLAYVTASVGRYDGTIQSTVSITPGDTYFVDVTATRGGTVGFWRVECVASYKDES